MHWYVKLALLVAVLLVALGGGAYFMARMDMSSGSFPDYDAAVMAGAIGPGKWLPSALPASSRQIQEAHDIDTNEIWFKLSYSDWALERIEGCQPVSKTEVNVPSEERAARFPAFVRAAREAIVNDEHLVFRACVGSDFSYFLAIQPVEEVAYGWSLGDSATR